MLGWRKIFLRVRRASGRYIGGSLSLAMNAPAETLRDELERFRTRCFWWVRADVPLLDLPRETLLQGLRTHGGREGMLLAARL